jgi:hypothetical protein
VRGKRKRENPDDEDDDADKNAPPKSAKRDKAVASSGAPEGLDGLRAEASAADGDIAIALWTKAIEVKQPLLHTHALVS